MVIGEEIGGGIMVNFGKEIVGGIRVDFPFKVRSRIFRWIWGLKSMNLFGQRWWDGINYLIGDRVDIRDDGGEGWVQERDWALVDVVVD